MFKGRSESRCARLEVRLGVSLAARLGVRTVDFRSLDCRLDRLEITISPPHPRLLCRKLASTWAPIQRCAAGFKLDASDQRSHELLGHPVSDAARLSRPRGSAPNRVRNPPAFIEIC